MTSRERAENFGWMFEPAARDRRVGEIERAITAATDESYERAAKWIEDNADRMICDGDDSVDIAAGIRKLKGAP